MDPPSGVVPRPPRCVLGKTVERQFKCSFQGRKVRVRAATQVALLEFRTVNVDLPINLSVRITYGCMSEQDTGAGAQTPSSHLRPLEPNSLHPEVHSRPSSRARLLLHKPTQQPNLNSLVVSTRSATSTSKQTCRPRPDHRPPQVSLSGALLCGCGASKHTDQPQTSLEGTFPTSTACVVGRQHQPTRQLHVDAERPPPSPTTRPKENAHWIGPLVT